MTIYAAPVEVCFQYTQKLDSKLSFLLRRSIRVLLTQHTHTNNRFMNYNDEMQCFLWKEKTEVKIRESWVERRSSKKS